jgi:hypothetical protein
MKAMLHKSWFAATAAVLLSVQGVLAEDPHDQLVYSRYRRAFQPTTYKVDWNAKTTQLSTPATQEDVAKGKAVFSFEGLGEARVWKLPDDSFPMTTPSL